MGDINNITNRTRVNSFFNKGNVAKLITIAASILIIVVTIVAVGVFGLPPAVFHAGLALSFVPVAANVFYDKIRLIQYRKQHKIKEDEQLANKIERKECESERAYYGIDSTESFAFPPGEISYRVTLTQKQQTFLPKVVEEMKDDSGQADDQPYESFKKFVEETVEFHLGGVLTIGGAPTIPEQTTFGTSSTPEDVDEDAEEIRPYRELGFLYTLQSEENGRRGKKADKSTVLLGWGKVKFNPEHLDQEVVLSKKVVNPKEEIENMFNTGTEFIMLSGIELDEKSSGLQSDNEADGSTATPESHIVDRLTKLLNERPWGKRLIENYQKRAEIEKVIGTIDTLPPEWVDFTYESRENDNRETTLNKDQIADQNVSKKMAFHLVSPSFFYYIGSYVLNTINKVQKGSMQVVDELVEAISEGKVSLMESEGENVYLRYTMDFGAKAKATFPPLQISLDLCLSKLNEKPKVDITYIPHLS